MSNSLSKFALCAVLVCTLDGCVFASGGDDPAQTGADAAPGADAADADA